MKNLILATTFAISSLLTVAGPSQAASASVTITTGDSGPRHYRSWSRHHNDRHRHRHYVRESYRERHGCMIKKVRSYRHGELVVRTTRVCR